MNSGKRLLSLTVIGLVGVLLSALGPAAHASTTTTSTPNQAGYLVKDIGRITHVTASWVVPTLNCGATNTSAKFVVTLTRGKQSVGQMGVGADCHNGIAHYYGWAKVLSFDPDRFGGRTIQAGDHMTMEGAYDHNGPNPVFLWLTDEGKWGHGSSSTAPGPGAPTKASFVTRAKTLPGGVEALTDFGAVTFTGCTVNDGQLGATSPQQLDMVRDGSDLMAQASTIQSGTDFTVTWMHV